MGKIRIYELARQLNMQNKPFMDKLQEMGITFTNHMSTLDDDVVERIREALQGKASDAVEKTRVGATVIRRRRRAVEPEAVAETVAETAAAVEPVPQAAPVPDQVAEAQAAAPAEAEPTAQAPQASVEAPAAADIAAAAEPPPAVAPAPVEAPAVPVEPPSPVPESQAPQVEVSEPPAPAAVVEAQTPEPLPEAPAPIEPPVAQPPAEAKPVQPVVNIAKRLHKDAPAKIIKLGVAPPPDQRRPKPEPEPARVIGLKEAKPAAEAPAAAATEDAESADKKKKGLKKKREDESKDKKFFKKKIAFRHKAVVEGADLYDTEVRPRKARKGGKAALPPPKPVPAAPAPTKAIKRRIKADDTIVLAELAKRMGIKASEMIKKLMTMGIMATVNQTIDFETAVLVAAEFDYEVERAAFEEETIIKTAVNDPQTLVHRPPVVTIMGHVDHGKTSLLDVIRKTRVTEGEAGGITQHIGAYHVTTDRGRIVFLDTPGHEAFTAMRSRGASVTDIVVLVVAADDGVMPQTVEAINHSKAAKVPIIVAVNKIDKPNADPDRVQRQLADLGLNPEEWGGDTIYVKVSAKQHTGIDTLLEMILLQAEVMELKANPHKPAVGRVVEAKLDSGRGPVATVLILDGTLKVHDAVVCGLHYGRLRALIDDRGEAATAAGPSMPVEIVGLSGVPNAGDELVALADEKDAKQVSEHRMQKQRAKELAKTSRVSLESLFERMKQGEVKELNLILKADVHGSIEALSEALTKLSNEEVRINVVHSATGTITESDVSLATVSNAIIIGFNVRPNAKVQTMATEEGVDMRFYNVIYDAIKDVQDAILGMMASRFVEHVLGRADVRQVFHIPRIGTIAGSYVTDGKMERNQKARLLRDGVVFYEGRIGSLKRFKDDAKEVVAGYECGIGIDNYNDIKVGDTVECYTIEEVKPTL